MIPATFEYYAPASLQEAIRLLRRLRNVKVLAGGHSLLPMMKLRLARPSNVIDMGHIPNLAYVKTQGNYIVIGPMATYAMLESDPLIRRRLPVLAEAASLVADVQVRNKGTIGGSLAHADPAADLPAVVLALEAQVQAASSAGRRTILAEKFFKDTFTTALKPSEVLSQIKIPIPHARSGAKYEKFANKASHFAVVGVAAVVTLDRSGNCQKARIGITGAGAVATRAIAAERLLQGNPATEENINAAADSAAEGVEFLSDLHGSAEYREHLTRVYTRRALTEAVARAKSR